MVCKLKQLLKSFRVDEEVTWGDIDMPAFKQKVSVESELAVTGSCELPEMVLETTLGSFARGVCGLQPTQQINS